MKPEKSPCETSDQYKERLREHKESVSLRRNKELANHILAACVGITAGFLALLIFW